MSLPQLILRHGRERSVLNRHPWLFSGAVYKAPDVPAGTQVQVVSADGKPLALAHWAPDSQIVARLFQFARDNGGVDQPFDTAAWHARLDAALAHRQQYVDLQTTTAYRLVNAEGDRMPGLIIDRYADTAVLQLRTPGMLQLEPVLVEWLVRQGIAHIYRKHENEPVTKAPKDVPEAGTDEPGEDDAPPITSMWLHGGQESVAFQENGLTFTAHPVAGQKTGFFLDQREARALLGRLAEGRTCLNAFGYTGGFAAYLLDGGADHVVSVDISAQASAQAAATMQANGFADRHEAVTADCFDYLRQMPDGFFDLIILDPPAFTKHIRTVDKAARGYKDINLKAMRKLKPGGILATFSCSQHIDRQLFRKIVFGAAADANRPVRLLHQTGHATDHPVDLYHPEGEYLKGLVLVVD